MSDDIVIRGQRYFRRDGQWHAEAEWCNVPVDEYHAASLDEIEQLRRWFRDEFGVACDLTGEIERLRAELDDAQREAAMQQAEVVRLRAELAAANDDAGRLARLFEMFHTRCTPGPGRTMESWCDVCSALAAHRERIGQ